MTERDGGDTRDDLAPLNLSTRNSEKKKFPSNKRPSSSEVQESNGDELPLNLSLRAPQCSPEHHNSRTGLEDLGRSHNLCEEQCDQRQTAALALCQLATASSLTSPRDFSPQGESPEEEEEKDRGKVAKSTTKTKAAGVKRANSGRTENNCHKSSKRAKTTGRPLRRRPRCS